MENNRLINFCHPKLCSTVSCNTCCSENYEETNLLSPDPAKFRRGFMADRFIKPPVEIQLTFKHPINLSYILLWPRVGQQKSSGFEVMSHFIDGVSNLSERIGYIYLSDCDEGVFLFCPRKYGKGKSNYNCPEQQKFAKRSFSWQKQSAISNVESITVRILKTNGSSIPALGKIEIWGLPGYNTTNHQRKDLRRLWEQQLNEKKPQEKQVPISQPPTAVPGTSKESTLTATSVDIPDEFLDGLTFEIMSVPMVLPSGKVVDQRTLERHQDSEANWGRSPSDPFTGRPFTATLHPILDTALKSRIDHFLVVHQDKEQLRFVPRTVGRKAYPNTAKTSINATRKGKSVMLNSQSDQMCSSKLQKHNLPQCSSFVRNTSSLVKYSDSCQPPKQAFPSDSQVNLNVKTTSTNSKKRAPSPEVTILPEKSPRNKSMKMANNQTVTLPKLDTSHLHNDDDLDDALRTVLNGLPSYVNVEKKAEAPNNCCKCDSKDNLFRLPCTHLICRVCLVKKTKRAQSSCCLCHHNFTSDQPVKYHA